jgi:hypothetical protein
MYLCIEKIYYYYYSQNVSLLITILPDFGFSYNIKRTFTFLPQRIDNRQNIYCEKSPDWPAQDHQPFVLTLTALLDLSASGGMS